MVRRDPAALPEFDGTLPRRLFWPHHGARDAEEITVGVINVAVAGCKIELFDKDSYQTYATTVASWMTNIITQYGGNPYQRLVDMGKLAQQRGVIKGILLHQGESNPNDKAWPDKVAKIYGDLIRDLNLKAAEVPLLAGETVNADQEGATAGMNAIIAELPRVVPHWYVISKGCEARRTACISHRRDTASSAGATAKRCWNWSGRCGRRREARSLTAGSQPRRRRTATCGAGCRSPIVV